MFTFYTGVEWTGEFGRHISLGRSKNKLIRVCGPSHRWVLFRIRKLIFSFRKLHEKTSYHPVCSFDFCGKNTTLVRLLWLSYIENDKRTKTAKAFCDPGRKGQEFKSRDPFYCDTNTFLICVLVDSIFAELVHLHMKSSDKYSVTVQSIIIERTNQVPI